MKNKQLVWVRNSAFKTQMLSEVGRDNPQDNAYGEILSWDKPSNIFIPVICGHGGSGWLCRACAEKLIRENRSRRSEEI